MTSLPIGRPRFVTLEEALAYHAVSIEEYGGAQGLRDVGMLDSALAMPRQGFSGEFAHAFPFEMAAAYAFHIAKNHPFVDGNKRTALMCCGAFLRMNGWNLVSIETAAADAVVAMVENRMDKSEFAEWVLHNCRARPSMELRDYFSAITNRLLTDHVYSFDDGKRPPEWEASFRDAALAMPFLVEIDSLVGTARENPQLGVDPVVFEAVVTNFVALYRIAEDMGYEW